MVVSPPYAFFRKTRTAIHRTCRKVGLANFQENAAGFSPLSLLYKIFEQQLPDPFPSSGRICCDHNDLGIVKTAEQTITAYGQGTAAFFRGMSAFRELCSWLVLRFLCRSDQIVIVIGDIVRECFSAPAAATEYCAIDLRDPVQYKIPKSGGCKKFRAV